MADLKDKLQLRTPSFNLNRFKGAFLSAGGQARLAQRSQANLRLPIYLGILKLS